MEPLFDYVTAARWNSGGASQEFSIGQAATMRGGFRFFEQPVIVRGFSRDDKTVYVEIPAPRRLDHEESNVTGQISLFASEVKN